MATILLDGRPVRPPISGVARYCLSLANALVEEASPHIGIPDVLVQYDGGNNRTPDEFYSKIHRVEYSPFSTYRKIQNLAFEFAPNVFGRHKLSQYDLVHETYFANIGRRPGQVKVSTIHDVIPLDHPEFFNFNNRVFAKRNFYRQVREASMIIAVSNYTKQRIIEISNIDESRIRVIGCGVNRPEQSLIDSAAWPIMGQIGRGQRYGLYIGNLEPRKNVDRLIDAWAALGSEHREVKLVVVGRLNYQAELTVARGRELLGDRFVFLGPVPEAEKWALLSHASTLILPSLYEGYGIPIVEAYTCGIPAIFARNSSMTELAADDRQMFDGLSANEMTTVIARVLDNESWVAETIIDRTAWVHRNRWIDVARQTVQVYRDALAR